MSTITQYDVIMPENKEVAVKDLSWHMVSPAIDPCNTTVADFAKEHMKGKTVTARAVFLVLIRRMAGIVIESLDEKNIAWLMKHLKVDRKGLIARLAAVMTEIHDNKKFVKSFTDSFKQFGVGWMAILQKDYTDIMEKKVNAMEKAKAKRPAKEAKAEEKNLLQELKNLSVADGSDKFDVTDEVMGDA